MEEMERPEIIYEMEGRKINQEKRREDDDDQWTASV
jgi:hypothetical protein